MKKILYIILFFSAITYSCKESELNEEAYLIERSELETKIGFDWFRVNYDEYEVDSNSIEEIKQNFTTDMKFLIFVKPTCSCKGTQHDFPSLIKTFELAGIPEENYEIWACAKEDYSHPYKEKINIDDLPECFLLKSDEVKYSILDTFNIRDEENTKVENIVAELTGK